MIDYTESTEKLLLTVEEKEERKLQFLDGRVEKVEICGTRRLEALIFMSFSPKKKKNLSKVKFQNNFLALIGDQERISRNIHEKPYCEHILCLLKEKIGPFTVDCVCYSTFGIFFSFFYPFFFTHSSTLHTHRFQSRVDSL
jgi:hypothetical protein